MSDDVKICPECKAEFYAHVTHCNRCEVPLILPGQEAPKKAAVQAAEKDQLAPIITGPSDMLKEFSTELEFIGIENKVLKSDNSSCSPNDGYSLFVPASLAAVALQAIEEFKVRMYPELRQAEERFLNGQCPACGADIGQAPQNPQNTIICPDCGLNLMGIGDECSDDSCGGCGSH